MKRILGALLAVVALCSPAMAEFGVSVSGNAIQLFPPASAGRGELVSNNYQVWYEGQSTLADDLQVDHLGQSGDFAVADLTGSEGGVIDSGTKIDSYLAHLDTPDLCCCKCCAYGSHGLKSALPTAVLTFENPIVGLALLAATLGATDSFGPDTLYPNSDTYRGLGELANGDKFSISPDGKTLELAFSAAGKDFDQLRIFTAGGGFGAPVPEPASFAIWSIVGMVLVPLRRMRRLNGG